MKAIKANKPWHRNLKASRFQDQKSTTWRFGTKTLQHREMETTNGGTQIGRTRNAGTLNPEK